MHANTLFVGSMNAMNSIHPFISFTRLPPHEHKEGK